MSDFLKEIRFPITALFSLVVFTGVALLQRQHRLEATAEVESLTVAKLLAELPADAVNCEGSKSPKLDPTEQTHWGYDACAEFTKTLKKFNRYGAMEVIGQFGSNCEGGCKYSALMLGAGWLHFTAGPTEDQGFKNIEKSNEEARRYDRKTYGTKPTTERQSEKHKVVSNPAPRKLYYISVHIEKDNSVLSALPEMVFTNVEETQHGLDFSDQYPIPGKIQVYVRNPSSNWHGPLGIIDISATALARARGLGIVSKDVESAYLDLRALFEREEIELPFLNIKVSSDSFLEYAFLVSIGISAWASFLLRMLRQFMPSDGDEPWILAEPFRGIRMTSKLEKPLAAFELVLFSAFHIFAMLAPVILAGLMLVLKIIDDRWIVFGSLALAAIFSGSMIANYTVIAHSAFIYRRCEKQQAATTAS